MKKSETSLCKRSFGRKALLLTLALLLAFSPVNWGGVFGGPADGESGAGERRAAAPADADSIWERVYAAETSGAEGGSDGSGSAGDTASGPAITVVGVNVKNTDTLEVGIQVGGPGQPLFQSVGLVLEYDKSRLTPMDWQPGWQSVESQTTNASGEAITTSSTAVVAGQEDWKSLAVYTPTWINSGTAQVYEPGDGTGVGAAGKGYLLLQANTEYPYSLPTARQIVTVKFQYTGDSVGTGGAITPAASFADVGLALAGAATGESGAGQQAGKNVAYASRIGHVGLYSAASATNTQLFYHTPLKKGGSGNAEEDPTLADRTLAVNFSASIVEGETQQAAGGGTGGAPIIFYDWDGVTQLGAIVVNASDNAGDLQAAVDAFTEQLKATETERQELAAQNPDHITEFWTNLPSKPLTYKKGYTFGRWILLDSQELTSYGRAVAVANGNNMVVIPDPTPADFTKMNESGLSVKAAYEANADMLDQISASDRYYTVAATGFNRFGFSENFAIDLKVERKSRNNGVYRCRKPYLRVQMDMKDGSSLYQLVSLENVDETTAQTVPNALVDKVSCVVVDGYQVTDWVNGAAGRSSVYTVPAVSSADVKGFLRYGTVAFMNKELSADDFEDNAMWSMTDTIVKDQLGLDCSSVGDDIFTALSSLKAAWNRKNPDYGGGDYKSLTFEEMQYAVDHNGQLM